MPAYQCTFFFASKDWPAGWSEVMWTSPDTPAAAINRMQSLLPYRLAFLNDRYQCTELRAANPDPPRDATIRALAATNGVGQYVQSPLEPWVALLVRQQASGGRPFSVHYLRGLPDTSPAANTLENFSPALKAAIAAWELQIGIANNPDSGWQMQTWINSSPSDVPFIGLQSNAFNTAIGVQVESASGFNPGDVIKLRNLHYNTKLARYWRVDYLTTNSTPQVIWLKPSTRPIAWHSQFGTISKIVPSYVAINNIIAERVVERKTGRPIDVLHGRRRVG